MHARAEAAGPSARNLRQLDLGALLEIVQRAPAYRQVLRRACFVVAVERAGEIADAAHRRQRVAIGKIIAPAVGDLRADVPAVITCGGSLRAAGR